MGLFDEEDKPANIDEKGRELIENAKQAINLDKSNPERDALIQSAMDAMYDHFATYSEEDLNNFNLQLEIFKVERMLENEFLSLESEPIYDEKTDPRYPTTIRGKEDAEMLLDYVVHRTRKQLSMWDDVKTSSLAKKCFDTSYLLEDVCSARSIDTLHFGINQQLGNGMFHHFTIARIPLEDGTHKNYLMDCTYRQFFTKADSNPKRIGVMRGPAKGCSIGAYMMMNDRRKEIAETLLTKGYIEATSEVLKEYFDSVVYSGRDKAYYDEHGIDYLNPDEVIPGFTAENYLQTLIRTRGVHGRSVHRVVEDIINSPSIDISHEDLRNAKLMPLSKAQDRRETDESK